MPVIVMTNIVNTDWRVVVQRAVSRGLVTPPPAPASGRMRDDPQWRIRRRAANTAGMQRLRAERQKAGLTTKGKRRVNRQLPELAGLQGRDYLKAYRLLLKLKRS